MTDELFRRIVPSDAEEADHSEADEEDGRSDADDAGDEPTVGEATSNAERTGGEGGG